MEPTLAHGRAAPPRPLAGAEPRLEWRAIGGLLLLCAVWMLAVNCPFIGLDDSVYIRDNPLVQGGLSPGSMLGALTSTTGSFWLPLTWISLSLDVTLFGNGAWGFHLTNVLLHAANVVLLFVFLRRATGSFWRSWIAAALYGVHPLRVESVAWATERKDVLSAFFGLLALLAYLRYVRTVRWKPYWASVGLLLLSLGAKPMLVTFPFLLLVLDGWPFRRMSRATLGNLVVEKIPFLAVSACICYVTYAIQTSKDLLLTTPLGLRVGNAVLSYALYLRDSVTFGGLSLWYPRLHAILPLHLALAAGVLLLVTAVILLRLRKGHDKEGGKALLTGWLWFLGTLVPTIGVLQSGEQARADRFTYFPAIGLAIMVAWAVPAAWTEQRGARFALGIVGGAAIAACVVFTALRLEVWQDPLRLYQQGIARTANNWWLEMAAGDLENERGHTDAAIAAYERAVAIAPTLHEIQNNLGSMLAKKGRLDLAVNHFRKAHETIPDNPVYASNYARAQAMLATRPATAESAPAPHLSQEKP